MTEHGFWSHDGPKHHLLARRSKRPISNFRPWGSKNVWNLPKGYFRDHWRHVLARNSLSRARIWKFDPFRRTSKCNPRLWSHDGQKDRIKIFSFTAAKMGDISRRDTFETTGIMFRSKIISPVQKFGNLTLFVAPQNAVPGSGHTAVKKTESKFSASVWPKCVKFPVGIFSRPLALCSGAKFSLQGKNLEIWPIWCTKNFDSIFLTVV